MPIGKTQTRPEHGARFGIAALSGSLAISWGALMAWLSARRYEGFNAGMLDLGNMTQAIASVMRGQPLVFTYVDGPTSRLAFHVELFYFFLAPLYALWPDPRTLLLFQAALYTAGAYPAYRLGTRAAGDTLGGLGLVLIYLLYPVAQTAVLFDFHGDTLAMPLLMFALDAADRRAWRSFAVWSMLAVSCKFYVAAPVALMGIILAWERPDQRRVGAITTALAIGYGLLAFFVIRPAFTTAATSEAHRGLSYISFYFGQFNQLWATADQRLLNALIVFVPALLPAWHGRRWLLPALPLALAALISTGPGGAFHYEYHHYAVVTPFVIRAVAAGVQHRRTNARSDDRFSRWKADLAITCLSVALFGALLVNTPLNPLFWLAVPGKGFDHASYGVLTRDQIKDDFLAEQIPSEARIAASSFLAPHLANRETLYLTRYPDDPGGERLPQILPHVDYVVSDALFDWRVIIDGEVIAGPTYESAEIAHLLRNPDFGLTAMRDGLLVFQRNPDPEAVLDQQIAVTTDAPTENVDASFGSIRLLGAEFTLIDPRRIRAVFEWQRSGPIPGSRWFAVSRIDGYGDLRIVHLPSQSLLPVQEWPEDQIVRETIEIEVPAEVASGRYTWHLGWYDSAHPEALRTDETSLAPETSIQAIGTVVIP
jgi:uncharacterized membrane protein